MTYYCQLKVNAARHNIQLLVDVNAIEEQDSGNINKTQSKATPNESSSLGTDSGGSPRCQDTMGDTISQTRVESSDDNKYLGEDASKQGRISAIDADEGITLVSTHDDEHMFDVDQDLSGEEVFIAKQDENVVKKEVDVAQVQVSTGATTATILINKVTLAQALAELKHIKPKAKAKGIGKGKAIMIEEPMKLKKKDQTMLDEEVALKLQAKLQAKFNKEQRLAREKAQKEEEEENIVLIETWDDDQAKINVDHQLAERLQAEEQ
nr:hypothetical protein [Tanacetum cinerariifolium]